MDIHVSSIYRNIHGENDRLQVVQSTSTDSLLISLFNRARIPIRGLYQRNLLQNKLFWKSFREPQPRCLIYLLGRQSPSIRQPEKHRATPRCWREEAFGIYYIQRDRPC